MRRRQASRSASVRGAAPWNRTVPRVGRARSASTRRSVDFPAPFGPITASTSPGATSSAGTSRTGWPSYRTSTSLRRAQDRRVTCRSHARPARRAPRCWIRVSSPVHEERQRSRITTSAIATSKLPLPVSRTVAVVSTRVCAPDVAADHERGADLRDHPPKPAISAARSGRRASRSRIHRSWAREAPSASICRRKRGRDLLDRRQGEPGDQRERDHELGDDDRRRRVEELQGAEGPAPPEQDRDEEARRRPAAAPCRC